MFLNFVYLFLALASILFLAYVTTKYIGNKAKRVSKGSYIQVIETVALGLDKQLMLVKVGEQFVLLSSSGKNVQFMTNINLEHYEEPVSPVNQNGVFDFKGLFDKYLQNMKEKKQESFVERELDERRFEPTEEDTIKSNLGRLRNITSLMNKKVKKDGDGDTNEK